LEPSPSSEDARRSATEEFYKSLWKPKVHYRVQKSLSLVPILSKINPVYATPSYFSKIYFNIILPPMFMSSEWSLLFWVSLLILLDLIFLSIFDEGYRRV
jgi:hypothetical protein